MPIRLKSEDNIQIISFSDPVKLEDFPALRLKIDQKIILDRRHFIFDLTQSNPKQREIQSAILSLLDFCETRQAVASIIHSDKKAWKAYQTGSKKNINFFTSINECQDHYRKLLQKTEAPNKPNDPGERSDSNSPNAQRKLALEKLIQEYKKKVVKKSYDPYELDRASQRYKTTPTKEDLKILEAAVTNYLKLKSENEDTVKHISQLSEQAKTLILLRKKPVRPEEILKRRSELMILKRLAEVELEMLRINNG